MVDRSGSVHSMYDVCCIMEYILLLNSLFYTIVTIRDVIKLS